MMLHGLGDITEMDSGLSVDPIVADATAEIAATSPQPAVAPAPATLMCEAESQSFRAKGSCQYCKTYTRDESNCPNCGAPKLKRESRS